MQADPELEMMGKLLSQLRAYPPDVQNRMLTYLADRLADEAQAKEDSLYEPLLASQQ